MGGSMYVHTFGAYFGMAVAWILSQNNGIVREHQNQTTSSCIGSIPLNKKMFSGEIDEIHVSMVSEVALL